MNEAMQDEQMPSVVRALRFIMIVQLALGLFGAAMMIPVVLAAFSDPRLLPCRSSSSESWRSWGGW
ncbi:hypothetical protein AB0L44_31135 [Nonomuraea wenchangensis]|uniref:hypothetical protein n=1 Tax=Nonomuraea wenchangensis TaxID=568860 RepID=UPI0034177729